MLSRRVVWARCPVAVVVGMNWRVHWRPRRPSVWLVGRGARVVPRHWHRTWKSAVRCATAGLVAPVLGESALRLLVLLVPVILDHVLGTVHVAAQRGPAVAMLSDPSHEALTLLGSDLVPVQARLEVVVPPLAALLCVSGTVIAGDLDPMDLVLVVTSVDQDLESIVLLGGPRASLLARWAAGALICGAVACHDDGDM